LIAVCQQSRRRFVEAARCIDDAGLRGLCRRFAEERDQFGCELAAQVTPQITQPDLSSRLPPQPRKQAAWVVLRVTMQEEETVLATYEKALRRQDWSPATRQVLERQHSWVALARERLGWHLRWQKEVAKSTQPQNQSLPTVESSPGHPWWNGTTTKRSWTMKDLKELFMSELKDIYDAEKQIVKNLPKMAKAAESDELRSAFEQHLEMTKQQVGRLEQVFEELGVAAKGKKCAGMEGIIAEGKELIEEDMDPATLDAGLIAAAQKVEHYEIATYGTLCAWAQQLGLEKAADLLEQTLEEEKETDENLTQLAENVINKEASEGGEEEREAA
jgi:ferritin-like metal-binding protein YciE